MENWEIWDVLGCSRTGTSLGIGEDGAGSAFPAWKYPPSLPAFPVIPDPPRALGHQGSSIPASMGKFQGFCGFDPISPVG